MLTKVQDVITAVRAEGGSCTEAQAKAAIRALLHPTPDMLLAAVNAPKRHKPTVGDIVAAEFNAAILAAIGEENV